MPRHDNMSVHQRISEAFRLGRARHLNLKRSLSKDQIAAECMSAAAEVCANPICCRSRQCHDPFSPNCIIRLCVEHGERVTAEMNELGRMIHQMTRRVAERMLEHVESHYREPSPPRLDQPERDW